jgi:hypothetical protein
MAISCYFQSVTVRITKTILKAHQYGVVLDPVDKNGKNQLGKKELRVGICSFFLHPGRSGGEGEKENLVPRTIST